MGHIASTYRVKWGQDKLWDLPLPNQKGPKGIQELIQIRRSIGPPSSQDLYIYYTLYTHTHTHTHTHTQSSLVAQMVKNLPPVQETREPWVRKIPWRREWQSTPVFLPGEFHGQRSLVGYSPWGPKESDMTELTHTHTYMCVCVYIHTYLYVCVYIYIPFEHRKSHICWRKNDLESYFSNFIITTNHLRSWWVGRPGREPAGQQGLWVSIKLPRASLQLQVWGSRIAQYWFHCRFQWFFFVLTLTSFQRSLILSTKFLLNVYYEAGNSLGG